MAFTTKLSNISSMGINPIPRSSPLPSPKGGSDQTAALAQWSVTFGKIKLFRIFGKLNANVVVCLIDELFNILLSYYCHGIHTPPRCDIREPFFVPGYRKPQGMSFIRQFLPAAL
ncbi:hypothetical protein O1451_23875 [Bacteroides fragilis]|uniref:hypothetical protein n=1 Tax=Bacteroides fragilis TaxID=817 RepID=UPI0022AA2181|nr:hypothetical protein [Bacteroides fragilis]MCZ2609566.1 hypothetical protein [Bacteroides fragilis]